MKLFGKLEELVRVVFRKGSKQVIVEPDTQSGTAPVTLNIPDVNASSDTFVMEDTAQTLTQKTLTSPVVNTQLTGTAVETDLSSSAASTKVPSASATKTYADTKAAGAASSSDNALARFDGTGGKTLQNSVVTLDDSGNIDGVVSLEVGGLNLSGSTISTDSTSLVLAPDTGTVIFPLQSRARFFDADDTDYVGIQAPTDVTTSYTLNLPPAQGGASQTLVNDGSGNLSWGSASGSGAGEINAILNPSAVSDTSGWSAGANHTVTRLTSGSPLSPIISTALRIAKTAASATTESSTSGGYYPFTLPVGLESKKLKVEAHFIVPATGVWRMSVYDGTTRLALSTDSSSATTLPAGVTGKFTAYVDTNTNNSYTLSFTETSGVVSNLDVTNVIVGPGIQPQGAVVSEWQSYTPSLTNITIGNGSVTGRYRRVGDTMEVAIDVLYGSTTTTGSTHTYGIPSGFTINTSAIPNFTTSNTSLGSAVAFNNGENRYTAEVVYRSTTGVGVTGDAGSPWGGPAIPFTWNTGDQASLKFAVPIAEWAGSGTVNLAQSEVEYAWNGGTWNTASESSSFAYGPSGATTGGTLSQDSVKRVQFITPIQPTDEISLEVSEDGTDWVPMSGYRHSTSGTISTLMGGNSFNYGVAFQNVASSSNQIDVYFAQYIGPGSTWDAAGRNWPSGLKWRVKKVSGGQAVGFGAATATSMGLVKAPYVVAGYASAAQTGLTSATLIKVAMNTSESDARSVFNTSTNRVTPNVAGWYQINWSVRILSATTNNLRGADSVLYKNGSPSKYGTRLIHTTTALANEFISVGSSLVYANGSTDYFEIYAAGYVPSSVWEIAGGQTVTYFNCVKVSD